MTKKKQLSKGRPSMGINPKPMHFRSFEDDRKKLARLNKKCKLGFTPLVRKLIQKEYAVIFGRKKGSTNK